MEIGWGKFLDMRFMGGVKNILEVQMTVLLASRAAAIKNLGMSGRMWIVQCSQEGALMTWQLARSLAPVA